jgi:signal transduction histidine kinase
MLNKNGDVRDCLTSLNLYPEEGILDGSIMDITERVQAEQERVRLLEQVRLGRKRLQVLSKQLLSVQEAERRAIALELHDRIGQDLTALKIDLQSAKRDREMPALKQRLGQTIDSLGQVLQRIRELSLELRPSILDDLGLAAALRWYIDQQTRAVDMRIEYHLEALEPRPEAEIEIACFRVAQEALTNILRHSQASVVRVTLEAGENLLRLTIQDDGIGFEPADAYERALQGESLGVLGMRERVELTGGELKIDSTPGRGTTLQACFSLDTSRSPEHRQKERHSP